MKSVRFVVLAACCLAAASVPGFAQVKVLFDAGHAQTAGNADWILDEDVCDQAQRYPTPDQSTVTASTVETYWSGAFSAFGIDLVKKGYWVETLPAGTPITYGDASNPQDLSNYDIFVMPEPNVRFTAAEKQAILDFVFAGGGLFMISDHYNSDRNNDGWDSPEIFNDLGSETEFGIHFNVGTDADNYFNDNPDDVYATDPNDPIVHGPYGDATAGRGLGLFGSTAMTLSPSNNGSVTGHIWKTDGTPGSTVKVTFATAEYGSGRVAAIGDSSPAEDPTNDCGHTTHDGWTSTSFDNSIVHLNAIAWLAGGGSSDTTPPVITAGPSVSAGDCDATVTWTTDEPATSRVDYGLTASYGGTASTSGYTTDHSVPLTGLAPATTYHYQVSSTDSSGNGPTQSADQTFTTQAGTAPTITSGPTSTTGSTWIRVDWTTDEASDSRVEWGLDAGYGSSTSDPTLVTNHSVTISGLSSSTTYHLRVGSADGCGNGPTWSGDTTATTLAPGVDISGWVLFQDNGGTELTFTFPAGTQLAPGDLVIVGRNMDQAAFEATWGVTLGPEVHYFNSGDTIPYVNSGDDAWGLRDDTGATRDGPTPYLTDVGNTNQRTSPADPATAASSWTASAFANATPGTGPAPAGTDSVVLSEIADNTDDYTAEFVELYYDGPPSGPCTAPDPSGPVTATDGDPCTQGGLTVSWTDPTDWGDGGAGTRTVEVFRSTDGITWTSAGTDPDGASPFLDTGGQANQAYLYRITLTNGCGESASVESTTATADEVQGPVFSGLDSASDIDLCSASGIRLAWSAASDWNDGGTGTDQRQYRVERSADGGATWSLAGTGPDTGLATYTWDDTGAPAGTALTYRVTAVNRTGCVTGAAVERTATDASSSPPSFAGIASATDVDTCSDTGVALSWSTPADWGDNGATRAARRFDILRDGVLVGTADPGATSFTDTGAPANTVATWAVRAVNACSDSADGGATASATNGDNETPPSFAGIQSVAAAGNGVCGAVLSWNAATPACGSGVVYNVYRSTISGFTPSDANRIATGITVTSFTDEPLASGTTYHWIVRAEDRTSGHSGPDGGVEDTNTVEAAFTPGTGGSPLDISGWTVVETDGTNTESFTFPSGTVLQPGDYVVVGRDADQATFESDHGVTLGANVHYFDAAGAFPIVNGDPDTWELEDAGGASMDGPTPVMADKKKSLHRTSAADPAGDTASWTSLDQSAADPGSAMPSTLTNQLVLSEISDSANFRSEFVELYYDAASGSGACGSVAEVSPPGSVRPAVLVRDDASSTGYFLYFEPVAGADGYNVTEGTLGSFSSRSCLVHGPAVTAVSGGPWDGWLVAEVTPGSSGSLYYLVTAYTGSVEGPAGTDSTGTERDPSLNTCAP